MQGEPVEGGMKWPKTLRVDKDVNQPDVLNILPYERIEIGQTVDVQSEDDPRKLWPCEILENFGGRLLIKYLKAKASSKSFWLFYLSERVHPAGIIGKCEYSSNADWKYVPPQEVEIKNDEELNEILVKAKEKSVFDGLFESRNSLEKHNFELNMKLEALHPVSRTQFFPASVVEILNEYYFVVELDCSLLTKTPQPNVRRICHKASPGIFPVNWCAERRLRLAVPDDFDWAAYARRKNGGKMTSDCHFTISKPLEVRFYRGQKLEAVNPFSPHQICVTTVVRFVHPLLWIHLDSLHYLVSPFAVHVNSTEIFPCGWCNSISYTLKWPVFNRMLSETNEKLVEKSDYGFVGVKRKSLRPSYKHLPLYFQPSRGCEWSPVVYFNPTCYTGPYVDKNQLMEAPREIGPGPLYLVLTKILSHLISASPKPRDLFGEFLSDQNQPSNQYRELVEIKAKPKRGRRTTKGFVEICRKMEHVQEWCRQLCTFLEACPSLVALYSLKFDNDVSCLCPYECKTISDNKPFSVIKCISKQKQNKIKKRTVTRKRHYEAVNGTSSSSSSLVVKRRRFAAKQSTISNHLRPITRGAQLPNFAVRQQNRPRRNVQQYQSYNNSSTSSSASTSFTVPYINGGAAVTDEPISRIVDVTLLNEVKKNGFVVAVDGLKNGAATTTTTCQDVDVNIPPILSNPFHWTPLQLYQWLVNTEICKITAGKLRDEHVDGQAFMLLSLPLIQQFFGLKLGPALKLCVIIKHLKLVYFRKYRDDDFNLNNIVDDENEDENRVTLENGV